MRREVVGLGDKGAREGETRRKSTDGMEAVVGLNERRSFLDNKSFSPVRFPGRGSRGVGGLLPTAHIGREYKDFLFQVAGLCGLLVFGQRIEIWNLSLGLNKTGSRRLFLPRIEF